ncbi:zinc finger protein 594-like [Thrips palmi]|uniref:Zinc finger protein 594-like n=1 Tax=Thrips palmi TaxID=161013 RepID=A0A6P8Z9T9_THRPL|nr:zinc finger protein 594-like [Thrips palmi]XP_034243831.1 zinc finger protein 594-like [Thrips palmi]XP_034243832.1 zinc finger protein 594-like [Thrips palmi]XP_034243833.1 zinc finger protein 594-like [Thrips palmi]XP_034243835.1 zinc finger protein 594-like [Thrips palmi]
MQAETEANKFVSNIPQPASSQSHSDVDSLKNIALISERQHGHRPLEIHQAENSALLPGQETSSQLVLHDMAAQEPQEHLHQIESSEVISSMNTGQGHTEAAASVSDMQNSETIVDIAAPEVRTRIRSQEDDIVVLQSTFTQTYPLPDEPKKVCHSVAVQTQFNNTEFEAQTYSVITGDGSVSYDSDGVRVLRAIGTWTPNYPGNEQFVDQNSEVYMNGSGTVSSPDNSMIQHSVSSSPNSASNCLPTATVNREMSSDHSQHSLQDDQENANKQPTGDKAFVCPVCSKGLARKDKLVIHMRIHTGEKPYVCEVCERAFARRDKLVMHMNKLKHLTPSNIAPLGKRHHHSGAGMTGLPEKRLDMKLESQEMGSPSSSVDIQPATLVQVVHEQPTMTWNCELCGRICISREEWTAHARSHLDGDTGFATTSISSSLSVLTPLSSYQYAAAPPERQMCVVCRQDFPNKTELIMHLRSHFVGKPELLANHVASLTDSTGVCS